MQDRMSDSEIRCRIDELHHTYGHYTGFLELAAVSFKHMKEFRLGLRNLSPRSRERIGRAFKLIDAGEVKFERIRNVGTHGRRKITPVYQEKPVSVTHPLRYANDLMRGLRANPNLSMQALPQRGRLFRG